MKKMEQAFIDFEFPVSKSMQVMEGINTSISISLPARFSEPPYVQI
jgi:hypothetical protein